MRARENPFATHRLEALSFRLHGTSWAELLARFEALGRQAALVGPEGSGKTALLAELGRRLAERGLAVRALPPTAELLALHRGNLRAALLDLYDRCAGS